MKPLIVNMVSLTFRRKKDPLIQKKLLAFHTGSDQPIVHTIHRIRNGFHIKSTIELAIIATESSSKVVIHTIQRAAGVEDNTGNLA